MASGSHDGGVKVWDVASGALLWSGWLTKGVLSLAFSPDGPSSAPGSGCLLASGGLDHTIRLWNPTTGTCVQVLRDHDSANTVFFSVDWSPDGHSLASGTLVQGVLLWDLTTCSQRAMDCKQVSLIRHVAWSSDGTRLVGVGDDNLVYVWDARAGTLLHQLAGHHCIVTSMAWSLDGTRLVSGSGCNESAEIFVWDAHSGECVQALVGHPGAITALAWGPSGDSEH